MVRATKSNAKGGAPSVPSVEFNTADTMGDKEWKDLTAEQKAELSKQNFDAFGIANLASEAATLEIAKCYHEINKREAAQLEANVNRLAESISRRGYDPSEPIVVSAKPKGRFMILRGHSRHLGAKKVGLTEIPAIVYSGLARGQELAIMADQTADAKSLGWTDRAWFDAVEAMVSEGYASETALAVHFGWYTTNKAGQAEPARNKMQLRVNAVKMAKRIPQFREALYNGLSETVDTAKPCVKWSDVQALRKADNADTSKGLTDGTGEEFRKAWDTMNSKHSGTASTKSSLTPTEAKSKMETLSSAILRDTLLAVTGQAAPDVSLSGLDARCVEAEVALGIVSRLREFDAERFDSFVAECDEALQPATGEAVTA